MRVLFAKCLIVVQKYAVIDHVMNKIVNETSLVAHPDFVGAKSLADEFELVDYYLVCVGKLVFFECFYHDLHVGEVGFHRVDSADERVQRIPQLMGECGIHEGGKLLLSFDLVVEDFVRHINNLDQRLLLHNGLNFQSDVLEVWRVILFPHIDFEDLVTQEILFLG